MVIQRCSLLITLTLLATACTHLSRDAGHTTAPPTATDRSTSQQPTDDGTGAAPAASPTALTASERASTLPGLWVVQVKDLQDVIITNMIVRFSDKTAKTCLAGDWHEVIVTSSDAADPQFFPMNEPLSYQVSDQRTGQEITLGRHHICESYFQLKGTLQNNQATGDYIVFGWDLETLGSFTLKRIGD